MYRKQGSELIPIVPYDRVDCDVSPEEGEIDCDYTGVCKSSSTVFICLFFKLIDLLLLSADVVEFDNSFSYLRSKKIWYSITIE